ncbi:MAG: LuxR C-terminal-related transcriptional regulator [Halioglobus sp.]|nr:LuxR C-terminal-related transcriptional regulator [Halioglobus sp.]
MLLAATFIFISILVGWDLASDRAGGVDTAHMIIELLILLIAAAGALSLLARDWQQRRRLRELSNTVQNAHSDSAQWRSRYQETVEGLGRAIQAQFRDWNLSNSEAEIGLLLLKGLGLKEIAALRGTSERTVREQARAVYRKSGVANRASLSAFFLEDLLLPATQVSQQDTE